MTFKGSSKVKKTNKQKVVNPKRGGFFTRFFRTPTQIVLDIPEEEGDPTDVLEVWFAGCHSGQLFPKTYTLSTHKALDVGGGSVAEGVPNSLGNISLRWMVHEVMKSQCGILFDDLALKRASIPGVFPGLSTEENPIVQALDEMDCLQPTHDQLRKNMLWWILEVTPLPYFWQDANGVWLKEHSFHLGRGRRIQDQTPTFHATVKLRMENMKYTPKAQWNKGSEVYIH